MAEKRTAEELDTSDEYDSDSGEEKQNKAGARAKSGSARYKVKFKLDNSHELTIIDS